MGSSLDYYFRIHQNGKDKIAAICDENIKGRELLHNGVKILIKSEFYGEEIFRPDEVLIELLSCTSINAFGKEICDLLVEKNFVHPMSILWFKDGTEKIGHVIAIQ
ncbi:MAG: DUF424 family protein [Candidatus Heimdallarchaeota archaeon]|nr:DUF424 family protein [Candidatus Heimdallarchaeota archaeon]